MLLHQKEAQVMSAKNRTFYRFLPLINLSLIFVFGCENKSRNFADIDEIIKRDDLQAFVEEVRSGFDPLLPLPKSIDPSEGNSIHMAAEAGAKGILGWLSRSGYDFNLVDNYGRNPLMRLLFENAS